MEVKVMKGNKDLIDVATTATIRSDNDSTTRTGGRHGSSAVVVTSSRDKKDDKQPVDYIVINAYNEAAKGRIPIQTAASIIVGRIRVCFIEGIALFEGNGDPTFNVDAVRYVDEVLFNDLIYILTSVLRYGGKSACLKRSQVLKMIRDTAKLIEYTIGEDYYNRIDSMLRVVYNE